MAVRRSVSTWQQPIPPPGGPERDALVAEIAARVLALGENRLRVGIDGFTAAGKTSFGHELGERIAQAGRPVLRSCLDDFKKPWRDRHLYDRESGEGYYRNAYDYSAAAELLLAPPGRKAPGAARCACVTRSPRSTTAPNASRRPRTRCSSSTGCSRSGRRSTATGTTACGSRSTATFRRTGAVRDQNWAGSNAEAIHRDRYLVAERIYLAEADPRGRVDVVIDNRVFDRPQATFRSE